MKRIILKHPFTMLISDPTGSGKTLWLIKLIKLKSSFPKPKKIYYFYGEYQPIFDSIEGVKFIRGLQEDVIENIGGTPTWIIFDDLMNDAINSQKVSDLFTKGSHHKNISVILLVQNFFAQGKQMRNISLNSHYIVLFKNPRDKTIARSIARQMYPNKTLAFHDVFEDATKEPHSYLFIDLKPETHENHRLLTNILNENSDIFSYLI